MTSGGESRAPEAPQRLSPGALLAERFRIVRFVGRGGMGEVYEAEDQTLRERVAVKTVRPEIARDVRALERLLHEVHLARRVTHPSVCRTFDVFQHRSPGGEADLTFVTMELLAGETLAERLARAGRMTGAEAGPIVRQVVAGLAAAQKAGVIHRDLKTDNVTLVVSPSEEGGVRAVVTDFGLARGRASEGGDASLTELGLVVGTPAYMAPEQLEAHHVTAASDIYALGVVMYEMVTGELPFAGETLAAAAKRLSERPPSPREHVPDLDPVWEAVILRCLERDPIDRFASVSDVAKALAGEEVTPGRRALVEQRARTIRKRQIVRLAFGVFAVALVVLGGHLLSRRPPPAPLVLKARRSVAVLGFKNLSARPDAAWLSTALSEMLTAELAAGEKLRTIPGESVARMKIELSLPDADTLASDTLARVRQNIGTDLVVMGSYFAAGKEGGARLRVDLRLQETAAGETVASVTDSATEAELPELVSRTGAQLRGKLGVGELSLAETGGVRAALPTGPEAARLYAEGLRKLRRFDTLAARDLLEEAVAADPQSPLVHSALAEAWSGLGYDGKAKDEARKALALSAQLPREERLLVEAREREASKDWGKAIETYRALWAFFPDNVEYGLRLAAAQTSAGKGREALATVEALRKLPSPDSGDPRIDLAEARAAEGLSEYAKARAAAAAAAKKGIASGAQLLVARARRQESWALWRLGSTGDAAAACEEAKRIYAAFGDRAGVAWSLNMRAIMLRDQGELDAAKRTFEQALAMNREIGDQIGASLALTSLGIVLGRQGDLSSAKKMYEGTLAINRELGNPWGVAISLDSIAGVLQQQGDLAGAKKLYEQSLAIKREVGDKRGAAIGLNQIAAGLVRQGDLETARRVYDESLRIRKEIGDKSGLGFSLLGLARLLATSGDLAAARARHEEALAIRTTLGEKGNVAESRLALAALSIDEGRRSEAEALARQAAEEFRKEARSGDEATALAVLAQSLLAEGRSSEAREAVDRASALSARTEALAQRLSVAIVSARVRAAAGDAGGASEAMRILEDALTQARRSGLVDLQLEIRLALGEIEVASGQRAAGAARLRALEAEATAKGFGHVARKARSARVERRSQ